MANEVASVRDPLGKEILILSSIILDRNEEEGIYDDAATVIKRPAILIEIEEHNTTEFFYFRSIGWNNTMLIRVRFFNNRWEAYQSIKNPSSEELTSLLKRGKQII